MRVKPGTIILLIDLILAGVILYVQVVDHGRITLDLGRTTVVETTTLVLAQAPSARVNVTSISCSVASRSCTISLSNYGDADARLSSCFFQQNDGGIGTLNLTAELPAHGQANVSCTAPAGMKIVAAGARVLGALFFVQAPPVSWTAMWQ
ncbi:MAG: hypothetical protein LYZ70_04815 [Nitrososphaerales archaeon]|nr:hypothetical protein [Nitrososphaerales archaeon]